MACEWNGRGEGDPRMVSASGPSPAVRVRPILEATGPLLAALADLTVVPDALGSFVVSRITIIAIGQRTLRNRSKNLLSLSHDAFQAGRFSQTKYRSNGYSCRRCSFHRECR
jgi:hypothetical protein